MTYNFGIIGLGMIARFHAAAIRATCEANLTAVFSENESKANIKAAVKAVIPIKEIGRDIIC